MTLITVHQKNAKWVKDQWVVSDKPVYQWESTAERSPSFDNLKDALSWIIKHDEEKNENSI